MIEWAIRCAQVLDYSAGLLDFVAMTDDSKVRTTMIAESLRPEARDPVFMNRKLANGKRAALNHGIRAARGDVIAILDGDTGYERDLVSRATKFLHNSPKTEMIQAVPRVVDPDSNILTRINAHEMLFWDERAACAGGRARTLHGPSQPGRVGEAKVFDRLGMWDEGCVTPGLGVRLSRRKRGGYTGPPARGALDPAHHLRAPNPPSEPAMGGSRPAGPLKADSHRGILFPAMSARADMAVCLFCPLVSW